MERAEDAPTSNSAYVLGHSAQEMQRLHVQARLINPITRQFFLEAGVGPRMRVLDVGTGIGETAFLGADLVGADGTVVAVDRSEVALAAARDRARELGFENITFVQGDPSELEFDGPFDAIVGRYVLMFQPDPAAMLAKLKRLLRPAGLIVFHEPDWLGTRSFPTSPLFDRCCAMVMAALRHGKADTEMGTKLHLTFLQAGLPTPVMRLRATIGAGDNAHDEVHLKADLVVTLAAEIERMGLATREELGLSTLAERAVAEVMTNHSVVIGRSEIAAWTRLA
jgi:ubiquinone/menaquinone biosynthesis C-methylase UbiE